MKLALFFFLSFAVHATAFLVPLSLNGRALENAIAVTILPLESASEQSGGVSGQGGEKPAGANESAKAASRNRTSAARTSTISVTPETAAIHAPAVAAENDQTAIAGAPLASISNSGGEISGAGAGTGGNNLAAARLGTGSGNGAGNGEGSGAGQAGATLTQARYRETPQPHYPDSARRAGKEGRVLLRVLVDEEGRAKAVEVNASSGHDMLDQAATEALKKWRFVPARAAGKPVETWVKVPIEFQLSNAKP